MATGISKKPTEKVSGLASPAREAGTNKLTSTWKNGSSLFSSKSDHRFEGHEWWWVIKLSNGSKTKTWTTKKSSGSGSSRKSATINLSSFKLASGTTVGTANLYPNTSWHITSVTIHVRGWNKKGKGPEVTASRSLGKPKNPGISALAQSEETGDVSFTISCDEDAGKGYQPRSDTRYQLKVTDTRKTGSARNYTLDETFTGAKKSKSYDVSDRQQLAYSQYVKIYVKAWCRGIGGKSGDVEKVMYVSWPNEPVISTSKVTCPKRGATGKVTVPISLKATTEHPVTGVRLQKLQSTTATTAAAAAAESGWEDCGVQDDGSCTALSVDAVDVTPTVGTRTWLRVKSWNQIEDLFFRYSTPYQLAKLYKAEATAEDDRCAIVSATSADDGAGATLVVGYKNDGNTGTEVTWSEDPDAWTSTEQPESFEVTWDDSSSKSQSWARTTTLSVRGLEEGTTYYFRARRYLEGDSGTTHSPWSATKEVTPALAPDSLTLSAPSFVERGRGCELSWAYVGGTQKSWRVLCSDKVVDSGSDAIGSCVIGPDKLASIVGGGSTARLTVEVTTAGGSATSNVAEVTLADAPGLQLAGGAVTAQPASFSALCSVQNAGLAVTVRSQGCSAAMPGQQDQAAGDVVWSDVVAPEWSEAWSETRNLVTNDPDHWDTPASGRAMLGAAHAVPVTPGTYYTMSVSGDALSDDRWAIGVRFLNQDMALIGTTNTAPLDDRAYTIAAPSRSRWAVLCVTHCIYDSQTSRNYESYFDFGAIGDALLVMFEEGTTAHEWESPEADMLGYAATITMPEGLDLRDGALYTVTASATDLATGLRSDAAEADLSVSWARQAPVPTARVDASDRTDRDGTRSISCVVAIDAPTEAAEGDLCDVWRVTPDGEYLVCVGCPPGSRVADQFAPYGVDGMTLAYRVVLRTPDGDAEWADFEYRLPVKELRVDFGGSYVELPYNQRVQDSWEKDFEARRKLSGDVDGYWNQGALRKGGLSTDLIRVEDAGMARRVRALARHAGPCLVRTPDGCCYMANVEVTDLSWACDDALMGVSLDATEVSLTADYMAALADDVEEVE